MSRLSKSSGEEKNIKRYIYYLYPILFLKYLLNAAVCEPHISLSVSVSVSPRAVCSPCIGGSGQFLCRHYS